MPPVIIIQDLLLLFILKFLSSLQLQTYPHFSIFLPQISFLIYSVVRLFYFSSVQICKAMKEFITYISLIYCFFIPIPIMVYLIFIGLYVRCVLRYVPMILQSSNLVNVLFSYFSIITCPRCSSRHTQAFSVFIFQGLIKLRYLPSFHITCHALHILKNSYKLLPQATKCYTSLFLLLISYILPFFILRDLSHLQHLLFMYIPSSIL